MTTSTLTPTQEALQACREYIARLEDDVPKGKTFEQWHGEGDVLLRDLMTLLDDDTPVMPRV